ncbi:Uncharacterised protein [Mycobacteroides abscessus subsp. abscessus]|nr:Uncharacterised protein [Mycobacteroides abscessus subsp. abscessus]
MPEQRGMYDLLLQVDARHIAENDLSVVLILEDLPGGGSDLTLGDDAGGHLIQQRLEQVMGRTCDQCHVGVGAFECLGSGQAAEPRSDDHDSVFRRQRVLDLGLRIGRDRRRSTSGVWCRAHRSLLIE